MKPSFRILALIAVISCGGLFWMLAPTHRARTPERKDAVKLPTSRSLAEVSSRPALDADSAVLPPFVEKPAAKAESPSVSTALGLLKQNHAPRTPEAREQLMVGIEQMGKTEAAELLQLIPTVQDPELRELAIFAFQRVATPESAQKLIDQADQATDPANKAMALHLLAGIRQPEALGAMKNAISDPQTPITDPVLLASSRAIAQSGHPEGIKTILARLDSEPVSSKRDVLLTELMRVSAPQADAVLLDAASPAGGLKTSYARAAALYALRHSSAAETLQRLTAYVQDSDQALAQAATEALAWNQSHQLAQAAEPTGKP